MQVERSGGGHEPEQRRPGGATTGEDDTLRELFAEPKTTEPSETGTGTSRSHRPSKPPARTYREHIRDGPVGMPTARIRRVTVSTVILALLTAGTMGYLAFRTGSSSAAFAAGLLTGLSGIVFGFGELVDLLTPRN